MEQEIDLRPYVQAVLRQWRLIVGVVALAAVAAVVITGFLPRPATARGDVLIIAQSPQLTLDSRFVDRDATMVTNSLNQRQAIIDLASSPELEARVAERLGLSSYTAGELLAQISITGRSDLLRIETSASTPEEAKNLAEAWAESYQTLVNDAFSGGANLEGPLNEAQQRYEQSNTDLAAFYAGGELVRAQQAVSRVEGLLDSGRTAQINLYTEYLTRTQQLNLILEDARSLQSQYEQDSSVDLGASLAALALRARLAGSSELPVQLNFDNAEGFAASQLSRADLTTFVQVLELERDRMVARSKSLAEDLATGNSGAVGLPPDVRARYENELAVAKSAFSQAEGKEKGLVLQRDLALRALEVLQGKRNERAVDQAIPQVSVRFVGAAAQPRNSILPRLLVNLVGAVAVTFALSIALIVGRELFRRRSAVAADARASSERAADTPVATD